MHALNTYPYTYCFLPLPLHIHHTVMANVCFRVENGVEHRNVLSCFLMLVILSSLRTLSVNKVQMFN